MRILCFGDSNTYGYDPCSFLGGRYSAEHRWVDILARISGWEVLNAGENGREIPKRKGELRRFNQMFQEYQPDLLVVILGGNDLLQGASPGEASAHMEAFLQQIPRTGKFSILLVGPPPKVIGAWVPSEQLVADSVKLAVCYRDLAEKLGIWFADAGEWNIALTYDGVHYTEQGHQAFAEGIYRAILNYLT